LWTVEQRFRTAKSIVETRPIYHQSDEAIRGHVLLRRQPNGEASAALRAAGTAAAPTLREVPASAA
jgi:hypothetical protein